MAKFRARARTVDMLGRQQIAGTPTAISELFKNAHDAYADRAEVDYYRPTNLFLLRDDGIGMTQKEFEEKWLTIGTESKLKGSIENYRPPGKMRRPVMGEKGIGRLAIARIGPQVLVMTRAKRASGLEDLVVALINWELFELPGINLEDIEIPLITCSPGTLPTVDIIQSLNRDLLNCLSRLESKSNIDSISKIRTNVTAFTADPLRIDAFFTTGDAAEPGVEPLSLLNSSGTHFIIQPTDAFLGEEIDRDQQSGAEPMFTKFLVGFANTMVPGAPTPSLQTRFRDWKSPETASELISGGAFVSPEDFEIADHRFTGKFDRYGQFDGYVKIYDEDPVHHIIPWEQGDGLPTSCGPFSVNIAYLQGESRNSKVPIEQFIPLKNKLDRFGGLYIYRDGIRVLPYGNTEFDWLNVDVRRNKGQSFYFFAHRRFFGAIEIDSEHNTALIEKAGREGFQTNKAYRQFQAILENFLIQLAADFFRDTGIKGALWTERRKEFEREDRARKKRAESIKTRKTEFKESLDRFFIKLEANEPQAEIDGLYEEVNIALRNAASDPNPDNAGNLLIEAEAYAEELLARIRKKFSIVKPRDIGLTIQMKQDWESYIIERERIEESVFEPAAVKLRATIGSAANLAKNQIDQRKRLQNLLGILIDRVEKDLNIQARSAKKTADEKQAEVHRLARTALSEVGDAINYVRAEMQRTELSVLDPSEIETFRSNLEDRIDAAAKSHQEILESARRQLDEIRFGEGPDFISNGEITGALEAEIFALREESDADAELVQLGMALAVVNHEFDAVIRSIRDELRKFKGWARATPQLRPIYERINNNFEHLDGYLTLFTPLQRRLHRSEVAIPGKDIAKFIQDLFGERLKRHSIELIVEAEFREKIIHGYPSTFYPVFVNIIDNAIFWLNTIRTGERAIRLMVRNNCFTVENSGPPISERDVDAIFSLRFSRKPGGRGMGLFISKSTLAKAGFTLDLATNLPGSVSFAISAINTSS